MVILSWKLCISRVWNISMGIGGLRKIWRICLMFIAILNTGSLFTKLEQDHLIGFTVLSVWCVTEWKSKDQNIFWQHCPLSATQCMLLFLYEDNKEYAFDLLPAHLLHDLSKKTANCLVDCCERIPIVLSYSQYWCNQSNWGLK